jgi:hypothetical protein
VDWKYNFRWMFMCSEFSQKEAQQNDDILGSKKKGVHGWKNNSTWRKNLIFMLFNNTVPATWVILCQWF